MRRRYGALLLACLVLSAACGKKAVKAEAETGSKEPPLVQKPAEEVVKPVPKPVVRPDPEPKPKPAPPPKAKAALSLDDAKAKAKELLKELEARKKARAEETAKTQGSRKDAEPQAEDSKDSALVAQKYRALLDLPGTPLERKPELLLRLAELAFEEESAKLKTAYELGTYVNLAPGERYPGSIGYYKRLVGEYPDSPQALTGFYNLGFLYSEERLLQEAASAYKEVLRRDPENPYTPEIHMRLGESAFSLGRYVEAADHYEKVVEGKRDDYRDKANFKRGWCFYKLERYPQAVLLFDRVLDRQKSGNTDLLLETIDVMGKCFVEEGGVKGVTDYLAKASTAQLYGDLIYQKVGDLYRERSRYEEAAAAYTRAVEAFPRTDLALEIEKGLLASLTALRDTEGINVRRRKWVDLYGPGTGWDEANRAALGAERDRMIEEGLRLSALYRHSRAQRGEGGLETALEIYAAYGNLFGDKTINGYEMAFSRAQALKEAGRFFDASSLYKAIAEMDAPQTHREEASFKRIEVLDLLRQKDAAYFGSFLSAHEDYVRLNPSSSHVPQILFTFAEHLFAADRLDEARGAFLRVAEGFPDFRFTPLAVERIARCDFRQQNYAQAEARGRRAVAMALPAASKAELETLISFSVFKQAEEAEEKGDLENAVKHFFRLADEYPASEAAQVSLYRGAENLRKLGRAQEAAEVFNRIAAQYKDSKYAQSALTLSSEILSSLGDWKGVADNYEKLYRRNPDDPEGAENLFKTALAREKAGQTEPSAKLFEEFSGKYKDSPKVAQAYYKVAVIREKAGQEKEAALLYEKAWKAEAPPEEGVYRAKAALRLSEIQLSAYKAIALKGNMEKALAQKEKSLDLVLAKLGESAAFPYPDTLAASLYYAGEAFEEMKTAILESERPKGLSAEELEQYQFLLEEKAFPLENRAVELYRKGLAATVKNGIHNEWVDKMYQRLEVLMPTAYQRTEELSTVWPPSPYPFSARAEGLK